MSFVNAIRAEFLKVLTTRMWWVLLIILVSYVAFLALLFGGLFGALSDQLAEQGMPAMPEEDVPPLVYSTASSIGYVFPVLFGALAATSEIGHKTLTPTFLANPRRIVVLAAKLIALAGFGLLYGIGALLGAVAPGAAVLALTGTDPALDSLDTWALFGRVLIAMTLWAVIGVGLGALLRSQVFAIVVVLVFTQFLEPILRFGAAIWEWTAKVGQFLPGAASDALVGASLYSTMGAGGTATETLEWWQGGLVLLAIAVVATLGAHLSTWRKDVT